MYPGGCSSGSCNAYLGSTAYSLALFYGNTGQVEICYTYAIPCIFYIYIVSGGFVIPALINRTGFQGMDGYLAAAIIHAIMKFFRFLGWMDSPAIS